MSLPKKQRNLYAVLGITINANAKEIRKGYLSAAAKAHPDKPTGSAEAWAEVSEAYDILGNPELRAQYDATGETVGKPVDQRALQIVSMMMGALDRAIEKAEDLCKIDIVTVACSLLGEDAEAGLEANRGMEKSKAKFELIRSRLKTKGSQGNTLDIAFAERITTIEGHMKRNTETLEMVREAQKTLRDGWTYQVDVEPMAPDWEEFARAAMGTSYEEMSYSMGYQPMRKRPPSLQSLMEDVFERQDKDPNGNSRPA